MRYKHIIWDWNGTLFNDAWLCVDVINSVLEENNINKISHDYYQSIFDFPVRNYYDKLGFDWSKVSFEKVGTDFIRQYEERRHEAKLYDQTKSVLENILSRGMSQSILSAYKQETLSELVGYFGLTDYFTGVNGIDNHYADGKIETGKRWIGELPFNPDSVLFIGDTVHDFDVAKAIGTDCVLIPGGNHTYQKLKETGAIVLHSIEEIGTFLDENR
mgnify:CR=1 FL=1|jgi:phosphoglycolate phosphatase